ncbi:MAG TPA: hypothetical protein VG942_17150 [Hyphomonadaceae bacterium]|nr:hypothetical protein [Hyphomonadaceae bacterium]
MISPRFARRVASLHKWLGLIVAIQLLVWTATGLFMVSFHLADVRGEALVHPPGHILPVDMSRVKLNSADALQAVVEDHPYSVTLKTMAGVPVYDIRSEIGVYIISAETGGVISPINDEWAQRIAEAAWAGPGKFESVERVHNPPREAGLKGTAWAVHFTGEGHPTLWVSETTGEVAAPRTDLWRLYDFFYGLHLMDYADHENAHQPWTIALAVLALSTVLFGITLLVHRFTRGLVKQKAEAA